MRFGNDITAATTDDAMEVQGLDEQRAVANVRDDDGRVQGASAGLRKGVPADHSEGGGYGGQPGYRRGAWRYG